MKELIKRHHPLRHAKSFKYAFEGVFHALLHEPNFRVQVAFTVFAIILGFYFEVSKIEWAILILASGLLLSAEMVNTVVEEITDHIIPEESPVAKIIKDLSAGFVLTAAVVTILIFVLIFGEPLGKVLHVADERSSDQESTLKEFWAGWLQPNKSKLPDVSLEVPAISTPEKKPVAENPITEVSTLEKEQPKEEPTFTKPFEPAYYGYSTYEKCEVAFDCTAGGCNGEICGAKGAAHNSICVVPSQPTPPELGFSCACVKNQCAWDK